MVDMRVLDTVEEPVKTIGKLPFKFIATDHMESGRRLRCELTLNDEDQNLTLSGLITEANPQNDGGFEIVFHPVEQESGDWLAINQYILKFERTHQKK